MMKNHHNLIWRFGLLFLSNFISILFFWPTFAQTSELLITLGQGIHTKETVLPGQKEVFIEDIRFAALKGHTIKRLIVRFFADNDKNFDNGVGNLSARQFIASASLYDKSGNRISGPLPLRDAGGYADVWFDFLNVHIAPQENVILSVKIDLNSAIQQKAYLAMGASYPNDAIAEEDDTFNSSQISDVQNNMDVTKQMLLTLEPGGTLKIDASPLNLGSTFVYGSNDSDYSEPVMYYFTASHEPFVIKTLSVINDKTGAFDSPTASCLIDKVKITYADHTQSIGNRIIGEKELPLTNGVAAFTNLNYQVPVGTQNGELSIKALVRPESECPDADKTFRLGLRDQGNNPGTFFAQGSITGINISQPAIDYTFYGTIPVMTIEYPEPEDVVVLSSGDIRSAAVKAADTNVALLSFNLTTDKESHVLHRVDAAIYADDDGGFDNNVGDLKASAYIKSASLYLGDQKISGPVNVTDISSSNAGEAVFTVSQKTLAAGTKHTFTIRVDFKSFSPDHTIYLAAAVDPARPNFNLRNGRGQLSNFKGPTLNKGSGKDPVITIAKPEPASNINTLGVLTFSSIYTAPSTPNTKQAKAGNKKVELLQFSLKTDAQAHLLHRLIVRFFGDDDGNFDQDKGDALAHHYILSATLYDDTGKKIAGPLFLKERKNKDGFLNGYDDVWFEDLEYSISSNTKRTFFVKVDLGAALDNPVYIAAGIRAQNEDINAEDQNANLSGLSGTEVNLGFKKPVIIIEPQTNQMDIQKEESPKSEPISEKETVKNKLPENLAVDFDYTLQTMGRDLNLLRVSFVDNQLGWTVGPSVSGGKIFKTTDGGKAWSPFDLKAPYSLFAIHFIDKNIGFVAGKSKDISKTTDGGKTWRSITSDGLDLALLDINCNKGGKICLAVGWNEQILRSADGGESWKMVYGGSDNFFSLQAVAFASSNRAFAVGGALLLTSEDAGISWSKTPTPLPEDRGLTSIYCFNEKICFAGGTQGDIIQTTDGGKTWKAIATLNPNLDFSVKINGIHFIDSLHGWAAGDAIWRTSDGGKVWESIQGKKYIKSHDSRWVGGEVTSSVKDELEDLVFSDLTFIGNEGWITGNDGFKGETYIIKINIKAATKEKEREIKETEEKKEDPLKDSEIQKFLDEIKQYKFTESTKKDIEDGLFRFENNFEDIVLTADRQEEKIERQKKILERRFEIAKNQAREEKYKQGIIPFKDIEETDWFTPFVEFVKNNGIVSGYKDKKGVLTGEFKPANPVTRAEILKMALELGGHGQATSSRLRTTHWSKLYLQKAQDLGIDFYDLAEDAPDQPASRGEVIRLILDVFKQNVPDIVPYKLNDLKAPEGRFIQYAANLGIVDGYPDGTFKQQNPINRAEVAKILKKASEILKK